MRDACVNSFREMALAAVDWVARYYEGLRERPVVVPTTSAELHRQLSEPLPQDGTEFGKLMQVVDETIAGYSRHNGHPRFFGYVSSPGVPVASVGRMIAAALNINVTGWRSGPAAAELERVTVGWLAEM